ncbi:AI-2E family transporter [Sanyastnella coralliicola]|uniref:AI-2E family transporter n=1 Tax=Sanyastnella coralliicola TaxID=3069118 RepID=UPI0027B8C714|nr:AI-2E family transporter [Longitalea sp. SCSIO 12813]
MSKNLRYILGIIGGILLCLALWYFRTIVSYVIVAAVISLVGAPIVRLIRKIKIGKREIPSSIAAILTLSSFLLIIFLFLNIFAPLVAEEAQALSQIDVEAFSANLNKQFESTMGYLEQFNLSGDDRSNEAFLVEQLQALVSFGDIRGIFNNIFGVIGNAVIALFSVLFITFFFLQDGNMVNRIILTLTPDKHMDEMKSIILQTKKLLSRYFVGLVAQVSIITLLVTLGLSIFGVENAFLIGFLAGLVNLVPYLGPIIGALIGIFIAVTTNLQMDFNSELLPLILSIGGVFLTVQLIDNFVIQPFIFSNSVNAHPLEIFIVISMAGALAGVGGMILAIPAYTLIRIIASEFLSGFKVVDSLTRNLDE